MQATLAAPISDLASALAFLGNRAARKLANNTIAERSQDSVGIRLHGTIIVRFHRDAVELNSGGYRTVTTKSRMNSLLNRYAVYQRRGDWFVMDRSTGTDYPFDDGMSLPY